MFYYCYSLPWLASVMMFPSYQVCSCTLCERHVLHNILNHYQRKRKNTCVYLMSISTSVFYVWLTLLLKSRHFISEDSLKNSFRISATLVIASDAYYWFWVFWFKRWNKREEKLGQTYIKSSRNEAVFFPRKLEAYVHYLLLSFFHFLFFPFFKTQNCNMIIKRDCHRWEMHW